MNNIIAIVKDKAAGMTRSFIIIPNNTNKQRLPYCLITFCVYTLLSAVMLIT